MLAVPTHRRRWIDIDGNVIRDGQRHHASVSPSELPEQSLAYLHRTALDGLPRTLSQLVAATDAPFLQAISDALSPSFAKGRIALVGDAACTLRPHTGSGTSKSADYAVSLAEALPTVSDTDVVQVLDRWAAHTCGGTPAFHLDQLRRRGPVKRY